MKDHNCINNRADNEDIISLRHYLHQFPELSMQERNTIITIRQFLTHHTSLEVAERGDWLYAVKHGRSGQKAVAFRADMDALPMDEVIDIPYRSQHRGVSHKCGHDGHCAVLCALALELDRTETERDVYLIFQPGEETGQGAKRCAELLHEKPISEIYAFHNMSAFPEGTVVYRHGLTQPASEGLRIHFTGISSHAAEPEKGRNPAGLIARIALRSEEAAYSAADSGKLLLSTIVGMHAGTDDFGISAHKGQISLTLRAEEESEMKRLENELLTYARECSKTEGFIMDHSIHDYFPETRNDDRCLEKVIAAAVKNNIPVMEMPELFRASEDFGYYLKECPGAMFYIGNGEDFPAIHTAQYDFNDAIIPTAVKLFLGLI